jgi:hypothetical protein
MVFDLLPELLAVCGSALAFVAPVLAACLALLSAVLQFARAIWKRTEDDRQ